MGLIGDIVLGLLRLYCTSEVLLAKISDFYYWTMLRVGFYYYDDPWPKIDLSFDAFFLVDIILNFFTARKVNGELANSNKKVAIDYLKYHQQSNRLPNSPQIPFHPRLHLHASSLLVVGEPCSRQACSFG